VWRVISWVSRHIGIIRLYSAFTSLNAGKYVTEDKSKTDTTKTKHNPEKANNTKHSRTKLAWFSRFLRHSARKRGGLTLQWSRAHTGQELSGKLSIVCTRPWYHITLRSDWNGRKKLVRHVVGIWYYTFFGFSTLNFDNFLTQNTLFQNNRPGEVKKLKFLGSGVA